MYYDTLADKIIYFVKTFIVVRKKQLLKFFSDNNCHQTSVETELNYLIASKRLHMHPGDTVSIFQTLDRPIDYYEPLLDAIEALCLLKSRQVEWYLPSRYPMEIIFGTCDDIAYSVTAFGRSWQVKYGLTPQARQEMIPPGEEDVIRHMAVVHDKELIPKLQPLNFSHYVLLHPGGGVEDVYG